MIHFRLRAGVMRQTLGREIVMLDTELGEYFELNAIGADMLELLLSGHSEEHVVRQITEQFEVEAPRARSDFAELLRQLLERRLIEAVD